MILLLATIFAVCISQKPIVTELDTWPTATTVLATGECLVGFGDGSVVVLDPVTGERLGFAEKKEGDATHFAQLDSAPWFFAPDPRGEILLVSKRGGLLDRLSIRYGKDEQGHSKLLPSPKGWSTLKLDEPTKEEVTRVLWTQSGSHFVTWTASYISNYAYSAMQVWTRKGELIWKGPEVRWVAVSPTQDLIAAVADDEFWLIKPGSEPRRFPLKGALSCIAFSPDGKRILVAGRWSEMWFVKASDGSVLSGFRIEGDMFAMASPFAVRLDWSPNGKWIGVSTAGAVIPSILDGQDGHWIDTLGFRGGQMGQIHPSFWTSNNKFIGGMLHMAIVDPKTGLKQDLHAKRGIRGIASPPNSSHAILRLYGVLIGLNLKTLKFDWRLNYVSPKEKKDSSPAKIR